MSSFTSVLKKIGKILVAGGEIATEVLGFPFVSQMIGTLSPRAQSFTTTVVSDWNAVAGIASSMEVAFPNTGSGPQRVAAGAPLVQAAIIAWAKSNLPGHDKVKDPQKLANAAAGILANFADAMNSFGE